MALFESYERRIDKINSVLNSYGARIHSKELAKQVEDIFTSLVFKRIFVEL